MAGALDRPP